MGTEGLTPTDPRREVMVTWQTLPERRFAYRLLSEAWPPVLPQCEETPLSDWRSRGESTEHWLKTLAAFDELRSYRDRDTLLRRAVELLREGIGLERAALFLLDPSGERLQGTWGTGRFGETTDERDIAFVVGSSHREAFAHARHGGAHWSRFHDVPLFAETERGTIVIRSGENVIIPIPARQGSLGLLACDWALTGKRADTETLLRATLFTRVLAPLLELVQAELATPALATASVAPRSAFEAKPLGSPSPGTQPLSEHDAQLAARAAQILYANPNEERRLLAKRLGTTPGRLGRCFKTLLGESLRDYKNRRLLERFLTLVDRDGGNLLPAALDAGFGSYAQFHRVFRARFGCSPIEYLRRPR